MKLKNLNLWIRSRWTHSGGDKDTEGECRREGEDGPAAGVAGHEDAGPSSQCCEAAGMLH